MADEAYPVDISVDYPPASSRGWAIMTMFGIKSLALIPHIVVLYALNLIAGIIFFISQIVVLFTGKYPEGMAQFVVKTMAWQARMGSFYLGLNDSYPPFAFEQDVAYPTHFTYAYQEERSRGWALLTMFWIRYIALIPHFFVLAFVGIAAGFVFFISQLVVLFTGKYPEGMHHFLAGVMRWGLRVSAYFYALTDKYPPFSLT
jgi:hypothetical protein